MTAVPGGGVVRARAASLASLAQAPLVALAVLSVVPRLFRLDASLWNDETFSTHLRLGFTRETLAWMAYDTHPPLYNLVMLVWVSLFGDSAFSIRLLPLLCSAAAVFLVGRVAAELAGPRAGLVAATLMGLSGASVFYAQEARSYSFIILLFLLFAEAVLRYQAKGGAEGPGRVVALSALCAMSHVYAFLFVLCAWALVLLTTRSPAAARGAARAALVAPAAAAPGYFLIALMVLFTREHQYLWQGMTDTFRPGDVASLLSFYLFGYGGANTLRAVPILAAALFAAGVVAGLRSRPEEPLPSSEAAFQAPWLPRVFAACAGAGLALSAAAMTAPWWLPVARIQAAVGADKHPDLIGALPRLLPRTGALYLAGYALLVAVWAAIGGAERPRLLGRALGRLARTRPRLHPAQVVVAFPLLAILLVVVASTVRPAFNSRYMLALLPFALAAMAVALSRVPAPRLRAALVLAVAAAQAASLVAQEDAYALRKPDYKGALAYASRLGRPVTGTAVWELDNLSRYYAGRGEIAPVSVLTRPEAARVDRVVVFVPRAYPLEAPHLAGLRARVQAHAAREVAFHGLTLYELEER